MDLAIRSCFHAVNQFLAGNSDVHEAEYGLKSKTFGEFFKYLLDSGHSVGY